MLAGGRPDGAGEYGRLGPMNLHLRCAVLVTACSLVPVPSASIAARKAAHRVTMSEPSSCAKMFRVYLQNDNYNMKEYVSRCLMMVMDVSAADARAIMMQANKNRWSNRALCGIWEEPLALHIHACLQKAGLSTIITPENGEVQDKIEETYLDGSPIESEDDLPHYYQ